MIKSIFVKDFHAVSHLETSQIMACHPTGVEFSLQKPNVIVGPNGSGKSALLRTAALVTLSDFLGESSFDDRYTVGLDADVFWGNGGYRWSREWTFLPGLAADTDRGAALYYRPNHIPGNEDSVTTAMVCGYFEEARRYDDLVKGKSSGQQSSTLLSRLQDVLKGGAPLREYQFVNWTASEQVEDFENAHNVSESNWRANVLKRLYAEASEGMPMLLLDEPEQSLDAMAEVSLWRQIAKVDCSRVQVVVATHSLFPLMHPEQFNIIEATPSYVREVRVLM